MATDSLDTNILVSYILGEPAYQRELVWELLAMPDTLHRIEDLVITEAVYVLEDHYRQARGQIARNICRFLDDYDEVLDYNRELFGLVFPYYETHPKLSFNDCYLATIAELNHAEPLFTFDRQLAKIHPSAKHLA